MIIILLFRIYNNSIVFLRKQNYNIDYQGIARSVMGGRCMEHFFFDIVELVIDVASLIIAIIGLSLEVKGKSNDFSNKGK